MSAEVGPEEVLMLGLAGEMFAIEARMVQEILDPLPVTEVPGARAFVNGLINFRGKVVPLADLRVRFGMAPSGLTTESRIVVIMIDLGGDPTLVGIIADKVHEVLILKKTELEAVPRVGMRWRPEYIKAIGKWNDDFVVVPNMERLLF